jgi:integrase/recombinase XerC
VLNEYSDYLQAEKGMAEASRTSYLKAVHDCVSLLRGRAGEFFLAPDWDWPQLDKRALEMYFLHLGEGRGWKLSSVRQQASALRSFFRFLLERGHIERNPLKSYYPPGPREVGSVPEGEEEAVRRLFEGSGGTLAATRLPAVLELIYGAGLRPSAVYAVSGIRLDKAQGLAHIAGAAETQQAPLSPAGMARLETYLALRATAVKGSRLKPFWTDERGRPVSPARLARAVGQAMESVGLAGAGRVLRQLGARHFRERGGDVRSLKRFLGAKRLGKLDRYGGPDFQDVAAQFRRFHPRGEEP